jgi:hypothetical protein
MRPNGGQLQLAAVADLEVIFVHKFDPTANDISNRFWQLRDPAMDAAQFLIWIEDIRAVKIKLSKDKVRRGRTAESATNPIGDRWEISAGERGRFMVILLLVMQDGQNEDPRAKKRRPAQYSEPSVSNGSVGEK